MPAQIVAASEAIQEDVEIALSASGRAYRKVPLDEKLSLYLNLAAERMAGCLGTSFDTLRPHITDYIGFSASIYERHHTMDVAKKASFLGLSGIELHSVDLGGASTPAALEIARKLASDEKRLVLIAGSEVPRSGEVGTAYYRDVSDALLDEQTELHTQANLISLYALLADRLMFENGVLVDDVEAITSYYRSRAVDNPRAAVFGKKFRDGELKRYLAGVYATPMVAVATDHGAAVLVANAAHFATLEKTLKLNSSQPRLYINAVGQNHAPKNLTHREDFSSPAAVAAARAFSQLTLRPGQIDYAWIYDCFTLMLVRQAADYFNIPVKNAAKSLAKGHITVGKKKIKVNQRGGILNTQAAISLSAATGLLDILEYATKNPAASQFLYGGNGGIDCTNSVALLSRKPMRRRKTKIQSARRFHGKPKPLVMGEKLLLYAAAAVRFNPGSDVPFALGAFRRNDGTLCLARIYNADLTPHLDVSDLIRDRAIARIELLDSKPVAVLSS